MNAVIRRCTHGYPSIAVRGTASFQAVEPQTEAIDGFSLASRPVSKNNPTDRVPAAEPEVEPARKLTPAMRRMLGDDAGPHRLWVFFVDKGFPDRAARETAIGEFAGS
jgi:hypothetical protein